MRIISPEIGNDLREIPDGDWLMGKCDENDGEMANFRIKGVEISEEDLSEMSFEHCIFEGCRLTNCKFMGVELTDVVFKSCDISNCNFTKADIIRCEFLSTKGVG
ncbi:MAG: pentapeptide repeat-containing protein, partial [Oscillospiraceae bacterium]